MTNSRHYTLFCSGGLAARCEGFARGKGRGMSATFPSLSALTEDEVERIEKLTMRWLFQAVVDFGTDPFTIFQRSPDDPKDVAQDVTREVLDRLAGYNIPQRVFGTVDYKRARYIILPHQIVRQALFVDSKAEKEDRSATLQMSQISMTVLQRREGAAKSEQGKLPIISRFNGDEFLTTTMFPHYHYEDSHPNYMLHSVTLCAVPNGRLQARYNPTPDDSIWLVGRNAPTRGEDFRVRLGFKRLESKARWRVQRVYYDPGRVRTAWQE